MTSAIWFTPVWLDQVLKDAAQKFSSSFDRWRELYASAVVQRNQARIIIDDHTAPKDKQKRAAAAEAEAKHEIALLLNQAGQTESDFYPYRYLASEGFLPATASHGCRCAPYWKPKRLRISWTARASLG